MHPAKATKNSADGCPSNRVSIFNFHGVIDLLDLPIKQPLENSTRDTVDRVLRVSHLTAPSLSFAYLSCHNFAKSWRARSRLYWSRCLQINIHFAEIFKLYMICTFLHGCKKKKHFCSNFNICKTSAESCQRFEKEARPLCILVFQKILQIKCILSCKRSASTKPKASQHCFFLSTFAKGLTETWRQAWRQSSTRD